MIIYFMHFGGMYAIIHKKKDADWWKKFSLGI